MRLTRPLLCLRTAMEVLDCDADGVLNLIELGLIPWAWDIAAPNATRRELRIYRDSLLSCDPRAPLVPQRDDAADWPRIFADILPGSIGPISASHLADRWTCGPTHLYALIATGQLEALGDWRRGPHGSAMISRVSIEKFLQTRRIL